MTDTPRRRRPLRARPATHTSPAPPGTVETDHALELERAAAEVAPLLATGAVQLVPATTPATTKLDALQRVARTLWAVLGASLLVDVAPLVLAALEPDAGADVAELAKATLRLLIAGAVTWALRYVKPPAWPEPGVPLEAGSAAPSAVLGLLALLVLILGVSVNSGALVLLALGLAILGAFAG